MNHLALILLITTTASFAAESIERLDPALDRLIPPDARIETIATGFVWSEGPVWDTRANCLYFSDVPRNTIYRWPATDKPAPDAEGVSIYLKPSGFTGPSDYSNEPGSNGLAIDAEGRLLCCEHGDRRVSILTKDGGKMTLADRYDGKRFNSPNDLVIHSSGDIYFTDPPYGLKQGENDPSREIPFFGVYRISPEGKVTLITDQLDRPNGIGLSPDGKTLYVAQSHAPAPIIMAYPLKPDGSTGKGRLFFDCKSLKGPGMPDGLKVDPAGNLFATGPGGVLIINPSGKLLGRILCGRPTANVAFGPDHLYITSKDRLLRVPLNQ